MKPPQKRSEHLSTQAKFAGQSLQTGDRPFRTTQTPPHTFDLRSPQFERILDEQNPHRNEVLQSKWGGYSSKSSHVFAPNTPCHTCMAYMPTCHTWMGWKCIIVHPNKFEWIPRVFPSRSLQWCQSSSSPSTEVMSNRSKRG